MNITTPTRVAEESHFATHDGQQLFYRRWPALTAARRGAVVLFHRGHVQAYLEEWRVAMETLRSEAREPVLTRSREASGSAREERVDGLQAS